MARDARLFARLDLDYADHPKIIGLSDSAFRAHIEMILYARKYLTDGIIPKRFAKQFASESLSELLTNDPDSPSLVELDGGDYMLHGYSNMNETAEEVRRRSRANAENGRRGGLAKKRNAKRVASESPSKSLSETGSENVAETETETETDITTYGGAATPTTTPQGQKSETAQSIVGEWIDSCADRPPRQVIGQLSKQIKGLLDEGIPHDAVRVAVAEWQKKSLHPSSLPSVLHEVRNPRQQAGPMRPRQQQRTGEAALQPWMFN